MITYEQFDTCINALHGCSDLYFEFVPEREIKLQKKSVCFASEDHTDIYKIEKYYYGRIHIGSISYFAEILGYYHPDTPKTITYHIVQIDIAFYKLFALDYSYSDLNGAIKMTYI